MNKKKVEKKKVESKKLKNKRVGKMKLKKRLKTFINNNRIKIFLLKINNKMIQ